MPGYVPYKGIFDAIVRIISEEGIKTMYSGLLPSLFLTSHAAIQFVIYEKIKQMDKKHDISGVSIFRVFYAELQDWALRRSHFQVLCIDGDLPSASVPIANAAAQCEIIISELHRLHGEGVEVGKEQADVV